MYNTMNNFSFDSGILNDTRQINAVKNLKYFSDNNKKHETNIINKNNLSGIFPSETNVNSRMTQVFKVPSLNTFPVRKTNIKSIKSPSRKVQTGRVRNDLKSSQQPKLSLIPRPSFINSRKSLHCSRSTQHNARKELVKKMVFLAECALKENETKKQSTPVKLAGLTPKKTPRSVGYFILPEFSKKIAKLEEIKSPIEDLIKKEMFSYSRKSAQEKTPLKSCENSILESSFKNTEIITDIQNLPDTRTKLNQVLCQCQLYAKEVSSVHERIKNLDEAFEMRLNQIPEYKLYNEFCIYQLRKEDLYRELKAIEEEFRHSITTKMNVSNKLKSFMKKRESLLLKQVSLIKEFEDSIQIALKKYDDLGTVVEKVEEKPSEETPKLRRSLRLSKMSKKNESTPLTKKLKKLDPKSRGIQKSGRH